MTAVLSLADAQALAARATSELDRMSDPELPWTTGERDRAAIASALRGLKEHDPGDGPDNTCLPCFREELCHDRDRYLEALLRHCAPYVEVPS